MSFLKSPWKWSRTLEILLYTFLSALILKIGPSPTHCAACITATILVRVLISRRYDLAALTPGLNKRVRLFSAYSTPKQTSENMVKPAVERLLLAMRRGRDGALSRLFVIYQLIVCLTWSLILTTTFSASQWVAVPLQNLWVGLSSQASKPLTSIKGRICSFFAALVLFSTTFARQPARLRRRLASLCSNISKQLDHLAYDTSDIIFVSFIWPMMYFNEFLASQVANVIELLWLMGHSFSNAVLATLRAMSRYLQICLREWHRGIVKLTDLTITGFIFTVYTLLFLGYLALVITTIIRLLESALSISWLGRLSVTCYV